MRGLLAGLVALGLATAAMAAEAPDEKQPGYVPADWLKRPTSDDLMGVWPKEALRKGEGGKALLGCVVTIRGDLTTCKVLQESPAGAGFGGAALALVSEIQMKPATLNGTPVEGNVRLPVTFPSFTPSKEPELMRAVLPGVLMQAAPTYAEVAAAFPERARAKGVAGRAVLNCSVIDTGELKRCAVISEAPIGMGFSTAAKTLVPKFVAPPSAPSLPSTKGAYAQITVSFPLEMLDASAPPAVGKPTWVKLPSREQLSAAMPKSSTPGQIRVTLDCLIGPDGSTTDCKVVSEDPADRGFGPAALGLSPYFKMTVWTMEGLPTVGARVRIPLRFDMAAAPAPAH